MTLAKEMKNLLSKGLGIVAAIVFPFFAVLTIGLLFDHKTGGDPLYTTFSTLFFFSPLWLLVGIALAVRGFRNERSFQEAMLYASFVLQALFLPLAYPS